MGRMYKRGEETNDSVAYVGNNRVGELLLPRCKAIFLILSCEWKDLSVYRFTLCIDVCISSIRPKGVLIHDRMAYGTILYSMPVDNHQKLYFFRVDRFGRWKIHSKLVLRRRMAEDTHTHTQQIAADVRSFGDENALGNKKHLKLDTTQKEREIIRDVRVGWMASNVNARIHYGRPGSIIMNLNRSRFSQAFSCMLSVRFVGWFVAVHFAFSLICDMRSFRPGCFMRITDITVAMAR